MIVQIKTAEIVFADETDGLRISLATIENFLPL